MDGSESWIVEHDVIGDVPEVLADGDARHAEPELVFALQVFEQLGSVQEAERARGLLAEIAV